MLGRSQKALVGELKWLWHGGMKMHPPACVAGRERMQSAGRFVQSHGTAVAPKFWASCTPQPLLLLAVTASQATFAAWLCQAEGVINGKQAAF